MAKKTKKTKTEKEEHFHLSPESREKFRDLVIERLREVDTNWQQPWLNVNTMAPPRNLYSNKCFTGMNYFLTAFECDIAGYKTPYYLTINQIKNTEGNYKYADLSINFKLDWVSDKLGDLGMPITFDAIEKENEEVLSVLLQEIKDQAEKKPGILVDGKFGELTQDVRTAVRLKLNQTFTTRSPFRPIINHICENAFFDAIEGKASNRLRLACALAPFYDKDIAVRIELNEKLISLLNLEEYYKSANDDILTKEEFMALSPNEQRHCRHEVLMTENTPALPYKNYYYRLSGQAGFISAHDYSALSKEEKKEYKPFSLEKTYEAATPIVFFSPYYYNPEGDPKRLTVEQFKALETDEEKKSYTLRFAERVTIEYNIDQTNFAELYPEDYKALVEKASGKDVKDMELPSDVRVPVFDRLIADPEAWLTDHIYVGEEGVSKSRVNSAFYHPAQEGAAGIDATHYIHLPDPRTFDTMLHYYSTAAHECLHSTKIKLPRDYGKEFWGDHGYALEEFVAELGSAVVCLQLGIERTVAKDNLQYIKSWIKACNETPEVIGKIIDDVWDATDLFMAKYNNLKRSMEAEGEDTAIMGSVITDEAQVADTTPASEEVQAGSSYIAAFPQARKEEVAVLCRNLAQAGYMQPTGSLTNSFYNDMRNGDMSTSVFDGLEPDAQSRVREYLNKVFDERYLLPFPDEQSTCETVTFPPIGNIGEQEADKLLDALMSTCESLPQYGLQAQEFVSPVGKIDLTSIPCNEIETAVFSKTATEPSAVLSSSQGTMLVKSFCHEGKSFLAAVSVKGTQLSNLLLGRDDFKMYLQDQSRIVWTRQAGNTIELAGLCKDFESKVALYNLMCNGNFAGTAQDVNQCLMSDIFTPGISVRRLDGGEDKIVSARSQQDGGIRIDFESGTSIDAQELCNEIVSGRIGFGTQDDTRAVFFLTNPHSNAETAIPEYNTGEFFSLRAAIESNRDSISNYLRSGIRSVRYNIENVQLCECGFKKLLADVELGQDPSSVKIKDLRIQNFGQTSPAIAIEEKLQSTLGLSVLDLPLSTACSSMKAISYAKVKVGNLNYHIGLQRTADSKWTMDIEKDKGKGRQRRDVLVK